MNQLPENSLHIFYDIKFNRIRPGLLMQMTVATAYTLFIKEKKGIKVGLTSFKEASPKNVKIMSTHQIVIMSIACVCIAPMFPLNCQP